MVEVYSRVNCGKCKLLKKWLGLKDISYNTVDIDKDKESLQEMVGAGYKSLPVVKVDGEFINFEEFNDILGYLGK